MNFSASRRRPEDEHDLIDAGLEGFAADRQEVDRQRSEDVGAALRGRPCVPSTRSHPTPQTPPEISRPLPRRGKDL